MKKKIIASALSLVLLSSAAFVQAADTTKTADSAKVAAVSSKQGTIQQEELAKIAKQGFDAVNDIQQAREALFDGNVDESTKLVDTAASLLKDDSADWKAFTKVPVNTKDIKGKAVLKDDQYVVINSTLVLAEDFKPTEDQQAKLVEAGKKINEGDEKGGINDFKLANIALSEKLVLLPLHSAQKAVATAQKQIKDKQYYEANLTLKSVVDSLVSDDAVIVSQN